MSVGGENRGAEGLVVETRFGVHLGEARDGFGGLAGLLVSEGEVELCGGIGLAEGEGELKLLIEETRIAPRRGCCAG